MKSEDIVIDAEIELVWGNANFGTMPRRDVIAHTLLKCACGYPTGHTARTICEELGRVTPDWQLTPRGKAYLHAVLIPRIYSP